jgi:hypothetical protein
MRAHITRRFRFRRSEWRPVLVLAISLCMLAIPATASGYGSERHASLTATTGAQSDSSQPISGPDYSSVNASVPADSATGGSTGSSRPISGPDYSSVNASVPAVSDSRGRQVADSDLSSLNAIAGAPAQVASSPDDAGDGFHWGDAALGAGVALSVVALCGAALFSARRRTTVSPA